MGYEQVAKRIANIRFDPNQAGSEADCKFPRLLTINFFNLIQP